jgi:hypothetical protein
MEEIGVTHDQSPGHDHSVPTGAVQLPAPTAWPMVLSLGISLLLTGMVTHWVISLLGLVMVVPAIVGWFFEVLPEEHHVLVPVHADVVEIKSSRETLARLPVDDRHRKLLPIETFSLASGVKGGIAGGLAMIVPAGLYGLIRYHSVWYAANLLAAGGFVSWGGESNAFLAQFHLRGLLAAMAIHGLASVLIGLLYGAMLPMFPRWPILTWDHQPDSGSADRLEVVHCIADCLWSGRRICGQSACQGADATVSIAAIHGSGRGSHPRRRQG